LEKFPWERCFSPGWQDFRDASRLMESPWSKQSYFLNRTSWSPLPLAMLIGPLETLPIWQRFIRMGRYNQLPLFVINTLLSL
jgi:hypothetical protein